MRQTYQRESISNFRIVSVTLLIVLALTFLIPLQVIGGYTIKVTDSIVSNEDLDGINIEELLGKEELSADEIQIFADVFSVGIQQLAGGDQHTLALREDGTVWAWGNNGSGRLGDGTTMSKTFPVQVVGLGDYISMVSEDIPQGVGKMQLVIINIKRLIINLEIHNSPYWKNYITKGELKYPYYGYFVVPEDTDKEREKRIAVCFFPFIVRILIKKKNV